MWCPNCNAEVAAELSSDNQSLACAHCRKPVGAVTPSLKPPAPEGGRQDARQLLARWTTQNALDPWDKPLITGSQVIAGVEAPLPETGITGPESIETAAPVPAPVFVPPKRPAPPRREPAAPRAEEAEGIEDIPPPPRQTVARPARSNLRDEDREGERRSSRERERRRPRRRRIDRDESYRYEPPSPPVEVVRVPESPRPRSNVTSLLGQICAYCGVGLITCGTVLVLWSYFGGPAAYGPTGWLMTTAGQMLLFLGVVTLISGGLEQTADEVARRVDSLGDKLLRIEMTQHRLAELQAEFRPRRRRRVEAFDDE